MEKERGRHCQYTKGRLAHVEAKNLSQRKISCFRILFGKDRITKPCAAHGYNFVLHNILYDGGNKNTLK